MKRQSFASKSGFTIFELMLVITIFAGFILATSIFSGKPQTDIEKSDRMQIAVSSTLRNEIQYINIGKMPVNNLQLASMAILTVSTGAISKSYMNGATEIGSGSFAIPFFDGDPKYLIRTVLWTGSTQVGTGVYGTGQIIIEPAGISFSGVGISGSGYSLLEIRVGYNYNVRKITLDRRTGKISETKQ